MSKNKNLKVSENKIPSCWSTATEYNTFERLGVLAKIKLMVMGSALTRNMQNPCLSWEAPWLGCLWSQEVGERCQHFWTVPCCLPHGMSVALSPVSLTSSPFLQLLDMRQLPFLYSLGCSQTHVGDSFCARPPCSLVWSQDKDGSLLR